MCRQSEGKEYLGSGVRVKERAALSTGLRYMYVAISISAGSYCHGGCLVIGTVLHGHGGFKKLGLPKRKDLNLTKRAMTLRC